MTEPQVEKQPQTIEDHLRAIRSYVGWLLALVVAAAVVALVVATNAAQT